MREFVRRHPGVVNGVLLLVSTLFALGLAEWAFRFYLWRAQPVYARQMKEFCDTVARDFTTQFVDAHPYINYARTDTPLEKDGIRIGRNFFAREKPEGVFRIACVGGSTTQGLYPYLLNLYLNQQPGTTRYEVMDFGCQGWNLMEGLVNYITRISYFKPDLVIIHEGINDGTAIVRPDFKADYTHYRQAWKGRKVGKFERFFLSHSWLFVQLERQSGQSGFDLARRVTKEQDIQTMLPEPDPDGLKVLGEIIRKLIQVTHAHGGQVIVAPMAYSLQHGADYDRHMIDMCNEVLRTAAREEKVPVIETGVLLKDRPDFFKDLVHCEDAGQYLKVQVFTQAVLQVMQEGEKVAAEHPIAPSWEKGRFLELQWDYPADDVLDYHIQVRLNRDKNYSQVGRIKNPNARVFLWKTHDPSVSPELADAYKNGPEYGVHYDFRVVPIGKTTHKLITTIQPKDGLRILERGQ